MTEYGERGPQGVASEIDELVKHHLDVAMAQGRERDRKQLILYGIGIAVLFVAAWFMVSYIASRQRFERAIVQTCQETRTNAMAINHFVDTLVTTTNSSRLLRPSEKAYRVKAYRALYQDVPACPPGR